jgi:hypothetical protein
MSDETWDSYSADDAASTAAIEAQDVVDDINPILDVAATDVWQGDNAASWSDWNADIADDAVANAASEYAYAQDMYAAGFDGAGDAAIARAELSVDTAASHYETASDYAGTAAAEYDAAASGYEIAADYATDDAANADATSYDTTSYDTTSYDTTSYDTTSYDTTSYDTTSE